MNNFINYLLFGWYPYVCVTVLIVGSIYRFNKDQYSWRTKSSQMLRRKQLMWGSILFHVGVLVLFVGHFIGLLTPINVFDYAGVTHGFKQVGALVVGGIAGVLAFIGCTLLLHRRLSDRRIRANSSWTDIGVLVLLWLQLFVGLTTTIWTIDHLDGKGMVLFMGWANGLLTFNPASADLIIDAYFVYKLHIVLGLTLFLVTPFTWLVHIWSAPVWYLGRRGYQVVRTRRPLGPRGGRPSVQQPAE
jgi:nitrate reductase gamma subunit